MDCLASPTKGCREEGKKILWHQELLIFCITAYGLRISLRVTIAIPRHVSIQLMYGKELIDKTNAILC